MLFAYLTRPGYATENSCLSYVGQVAKFVPTFLFIRGRSLRVWYKEKQACFTVMSRHRVALHGFVSFAMTTD